MRNFMNKKELLKKNIIEACVKGNITVKLASQRLGFSERYVKKLKQQFKLKGDDIFYTEIVVDNLLLQFLLLLNQKYSN